MSGDEGPICGVVHEETRVHTSTRHLCEETCCCAEGWGG